jgi:hypothetical protein
MADSSGGFEGLQAFAHRPRQPVAPALKNEAGNDLVRAIFGKEAMAEDSVR